MKHISQVIPITDVTDVEKQIATLETQLEALKLQHGNLISQRYQQRYIKELHDFLLRKRAISFAVDYWVDDEEDERISLTGSYPDQVYYVFRGDTTPFEAWGRVFPGTERVYGVVQLENDQVVWQAVQAEIKSTEIIKIENEEGNIERTVTDVFTRNFGDNE